MREGSGQVSAMWIQSLSASPLTICFSHLLQSLLLRLASRSGCGACVKAAGHGVTKVGGACLAVAALPCIALFKGCTMCSAGISKCFACGVQCVSERFSSCGECTQETMDSVGTGELSAFGMLQGLSARSLPLTHVSLPLRAPLQAAWHALTRSRVLCAVSSLAHPPKANPYASHRPRGCAS